MENKEGYKKTELGWIPVEWEVKQLGEFVENLKGGAPLRPSDFTDNGFKVLPKKGVVAGGILNIDKNYQTFCSIEYASDNSNNIVDKEYLITTLRDLVPTGPSIGYIVKIISDEKFILAQGVYGLKTTENINNDYLIQFSNTKQYRKIMQTIMVGSTQVHIRNTDFLNVKLPLPPLPEQQKIASILTTVDDKISSIEAQIQQTEQLKKGLMAKLLTEGIGHTEFKDTEIGRIPKGWEVVTLQTLLDRKSILHHSDGNHGSLYPRSNEFITHGIPYIGANSIQNGRINLTKAKYLSEAMAATFKKGVAYNGDVLFASNATVGPVALLYLPYNYSILSTTLTLYRCDINQINNYYLFFYLSSALFTEQYLPLIKQTTRNQLPITAQRTLKIILPPFSEQQQIASILSSVDDKIDILQSKKSAYTTLKKGLMAKLLTGQMRVKI